MFPPERIVCLTEETVETLYLDGWPRRRQFHRHFKRPESAGYPLG